MPTDAAARAAAAGRAKRKAEQAAPKRDGLVPTTAIENRAQDRARARRERLGVGGVPAQQVSNPGVGMPGQLLPPGLAPAYAEAMPQRLVPAGWQVQNPTVGMPFGGAAVVQQGPPAQPAGPYPLPGHQLPPGHSDAPQQSPAYAQPNYQQPYPGAQPQPYGAVPYGPVPHGPVPHGPVPYGPVPYGPMPYSPVPHGMSPYAYAQLPPMLPPRLPWTRKQRSAALLSSWLGQTVMAFGTHLLTAFCLIVAFAALLQMSGDSTDFDADNFTAILARWTMPDRIWATVIIGLLIGGGILAGGWLLQAVWGKSAGLAKPHRATWLAWLCTTAATGMIGLMVWPFALIGGFMIVLFNNESSLTTGTMWSVLFWELGIAVVLTGGVGLLFGWLFYSQSRARIDYQAIALAEEAAARAADEAELAEVQLRWETSTSQNSDAGPGAAHR